MLPGAVLCCAIPFPSPHFYGEEVGAHASCTSGHLLPSRRPISSPRCPTYVLTCLPTCLTVAQVRGLGLLVGVQLDFPAGPVVEAARAAGVLIITAGKGDVVRLVPPLTISEEEIDAAVAVLGRVLAAAAP